MNAWEMITEMSTKELQEKYQELFRIEEESDELDRRIYLLKVLIKEELMLRKWSKIGSKEA